MVHTRFFDSKTAALIGFAETKMELTKILALIPIEAEANAESMRTATNAITDFVERCE